MAADPNRAIIELDNKTENESETEVNGGESHVDGELGINSFSTSAFRVFRPIPPFLQKLYDILSNDEFNSAVSWSFTGTSFIIKNSHSFAADVLPMYFKHNNFQSFMSQLNSYGFKKISWEQWEYKNDNFRKGERNLLTNIRRKDHCPSRFLSSSDKKSSPCMENDVMKEHHQLRDEMMMLKEKHKILEDKIVSLGNEATRNKEDMQRMMVAAQRIVKKQSDDEGIAIGGVIMSDETDGRKGKRKLEMESTSTPNADMGKVVLDEEEMGRHTLISLEDLFGEEYVRDAQEKASYVQFELG